jgi:hypothetical protein
LCTIDYTYLLIVVMFYIIFGWTFTFISGGCFDNCIILWAGRNITKFEGSD